MQLHNICQQYQVCDSDVLMIYDNMRKKSSYCRKSLFSWIYHCQPVCVKTDVPTTETININLVWDKGETIFFLFSHLRRIWNQAGAKAGVLLLFYKLHFSHNWDLAFFELAVWFKTKQQPDLIYIIIKVLVAELKPMWVFDGL